ncbi:ATP-binding protein [Allomesorhizobium camelthorni]|uniref:DeoR family transcriptional regulator n=1 Tax=Allomesorhizobium camelthorni TaxID=475069 RepID=A0A6G4WII5_9HYPH|nr:ATP-binding protein [Mesorhizobium camelthorni]NGO54571.1 DeoR family transcriptional regulator [Mesorhizobium camelthorni]
MISADIRKQIKAGENAGTAFVADPGDLDAIAAAVCSFLNGRGGVVFVGVTPDGEIVGVGANPDSERRHLETRLQEMISPKALFTLSIDTEDDRPIVSIEAPQGRDVPYVVNGRVFVRRGKRTMVADPAELRQIIQGRSVEPDRWERRPSLGLSEDDLDQSEIDATIREARESERFKFEDKSGLRGTLRQLGLVVSGGLTNACDVLFANRPPTRHPQCRVRFIQFETDKAGSAYLDDHWVDGPLVQVYWEIIERVGAHVRVQAYFAPSEHTRRDRVNYSIEALREGLVNALAHRDYASFSGGVSVSIYPDRIEMWNSGRLPREIKVGDLRKPHPSIPTNPDIAHVIYLRRLMERVGRGTQKIIAACEELGAQPPKWQDSASGVTLTIYSAGAAEGARLNPRQAHLMERLRPGDMLRLGDYLQDQQISERQARRDLSELEEAGFLVRSGRARATVYQRTERTV